MMKTIEGYTYKINEHIGKGYSSTVHKGTNDKTGEHVSIKVIEMAKLEDPINQMLLQHEITALKKLSFSAGVLHLYDVYATKNNTYIVTELCEGDLGNLLKKRKNFAYHEAVEIIRQVINGYLDVYNTGYVHRDIKPANIFYKGGTYKIGDFGFAIPRKELEEHKHYNVGSPVYMPPEALKDNLYSVSCDTWAIGIILYQIIKGVVPWRAISEQKLHQKILTEPLDQLTLGLPEVARAFLAKVLHLDPKHRMTIEEMVTWPAKLATVEIVGMGPPSCSPLRQLKNQNNLNIPQVVQPKPILTPKQSPNNPFRFHAIPAPPPTQKHLNSNNNAEYFSRPTSYPNPLPPSTVNQNENKVLKTVASECEDTAVMETGKLANNLLNYVNFVHRVVKFTGPPSSVQLPDLVNSLTCHLFAELDNLAEYVKNPSSCSFDRWETFLSSQKGGAFKSKLAQTTTKHKMFHIPNDTYSKELSEELIREGICRLMGELKEGEQGNEKSIIALDYLTTLYQLWHLKSKHGLREFLRMSKIDMIMEGNPYSVTGCHLAQLKRKLILIDILN